MDETIDTEFNEYIIKDVIDHNHYWEIVIGDECTFGVSKNSLVTPTVGMTARLYGKGIGFTIRGLHLDGEEVFYRMEEDQEAEDNLKSINQESSGNVSMNTIWKYELLTEDRQTIIMPIGAELLTVQVQNGRPCLWARVNPDDGLEERIIITHGTGHNVPNTTGNYIGTYQLYDGGLIFHVFEGRQ